ncbi:MAG TPA: three-Cys-motif partner protein TcmP [Candidatus Methanoperedenaceae archaeon]|nr:three-Cys-motif partner protein TcmP [Candidatus Methanoperedenaceae archaeon]
MSIWLKGVGGKISLDYVDLFASDGKCELDAELETPLRWDGSALLAVKMSKDYRNRWTCYLNELKSDVFAMLRDNLKTYEPWDGELFNEDANVVIDKILSKINPDYPSLFFIDPQKHSDLPWKTIDKIANHVGYENRRPEMIINLMTTGMQRNLDKAPESISLALGMSEDAWRKIIETEYKSGKTYHEAFRDIYCAKLFQIYGINPVYLSVENKKESTVFYLIAISSRDLGNKILSSLTKCVEGYKKDRWSKELSDIEIQIDVAKMKKGGQRFISEY